jgi:hypothetical protein
MNDPLKDQVKDSCDVLSKNINKLAKVLDHFDRLDENSGRQEVLNRFKA